MKKNWRETLILMILSLLFFVPRYFAHLQYDALEDEILAIDFNQSFSLKELLQCPDPAHPMIWYLIMEAPTAFLGINNGIFYYRLIQVMLLFITIICIYLFYRKENYSFLIAFFLLLFSNISIVHLSFQHRMFGLTISFSIIYSFYWFFILKNNLKIKFANVLFLSLFAILLFFTSYSSVWLIPIWPLTYLLYKKNFSSLKIFMQFFLIFFFGICWFLPTFFKNVAITIIGNQWAPDVNIFNFFELFANYFGMLMVYTPEKTYNSFIIPFFIVLFFIMCHSMFCSKNQSLTKSLLFSTTLSLIFFVILSKITGNRLFYPRTSFPILIPFYIIITLFFTEKNKFSNLVFSLFIVIQISQFPLYFMLLDTKKIYSVFNYTKHPISFFYEFSFPSNSCLFTIPSWNYLQAKYFLGSVVKILDTDSFLRNESNYECDNIYLLDQFSVDRKVVYQDLFQIQEMGYDAFLKSSHDNQNLYLLNKNK